MNKPVKTVSTMDSKIDIGWIFKDAKCWVYYPNKQQGQIYQRGTVQKITPLSFNKGNSNVKGILESGIEFQTKASLLEKCRQSRSIERDLIQMDIINGAQVLNQLKKRFQEKKIHTYLWNSIIIVNPFQLIQKSYGQKVLQYYYESIFLNSDSSLVAAEPHIYSFIFNILRQLKNSDLIQVLSISGESGSGKTQTNKQCLKAISYCCQKQKLRSQQDISDHKMQLKILQCDPILQAFGNAKTVKNDNSSRFGKLINIKLQSQTMIIKHSSIRNYFLEKSRIISQAAGERNFHIFYMFLKFMPEQQKATYKLKLKNGTSMKYENFNYLNQKHSFGNNSLHISEKQMWNDLQESFVTLGFKKELVSEIWSIVSAILLLGNINFDGSLQNDNDPCEILNMDIVISIASLLKISKQELETGLIFNKKMIAGQLMYLPLTEKQCKQGRDSMAKAIYESLFRWIVQQLNDKVNQVQSSQLIGTKQIKLLDIYGFEVFQNNSFQQLCVNYTNQKIHQIYLEQVFIHEKKILKSQGLQASIPTLNFTDNFKIIDLIESSANSIYNLLDQSCTLQVRDIDFLSNIRKAHENHQHFPPSNNNNIRNSFIIRHTPGDIQYMVEGFRQKNKDLLREDIIHKLSQSGLSILQSIFKEKAQLIKSDSKKKYLGFKIRKQVKQLIMEMSTNSNLHFVRCIKPNEQKKAFTFIDRVCYNQIKYLGILDTIQMRKDSYHVRIPYKKFYQTFGILEGGEDNSLDKLIALEGDLYTNADCKQMAMKMLTNKFTNHKLEYLLGKQKIFMKMSTKNFLDVSLRNKIVKIQHSSTLIKAFYKLYKNKKSRALFKPNTLKIQSAIRRFLYVCKLSAKKRAVLVIEDHWIRYCLQYFMRKRKKHIMVVQNYIKRSVSARNQRKKAEAMKYAKIMIRSALKTKRCESFISQYNQVKSVVNQSVYDAVWLKIKQHYKGKIEKYLQTFSVRKLNKEILYKTQKTAVYRENVRFIKTVESYFHGFILSKRIDKYLKDISTVQRYLRMRPYRSMYTNLRQNTIKIQRLWRQYYINKQASIQQTQMYFESMMRDQKSLINRMLYRPTAQDMQNCGSQEFPSHCIENVLYCNEKVKRDKINLFYYILDFEMLCDLNYIYPQQSWIQNYCTLHKECLQKGNPIQYLDVSNTHTIVTTINKIYQWGQIYEDNNMRTQIEYQNIPTPPNNRISKIKACDGFTVIQVQEPQELLIMGNQKAYQQSSIKEWSTLKDSYVLLNGIILTLKDVSLTRMQLSQKVTYLSCGMAHTLCKTSLRRVYSWGQNTMGQLGHGSYARIHQPKFIDFFQKNKIVISQIGTTAYGSVILDTNSKVWWFGSNGTIKYEPHPVQAFLPLKTEVIDNSKKYSIVRIIPKWSKSISLVGVTIALHDGAFKSTQTTLRKKCIENLMVKWADDVETINPPYVQTISGSFLEKHMYFRKNSTKKQESMSYQQVKGKLLNQILMIQHAEKQLLKTIRIQKN